jgi:PTS system fructose-specific IIC component
MLDINRVAEASLADYTSRPLIISALREKDVPGVIGELSHVLQREGCVPDVLPFYHAALNQELLSSTALPCGVAFPHARLSGVKELRFAFGRSSTPISWGGKGAWPVQFVFLIAVPATDAASYLYLLASLGRLGQQAEVLSELRSCEGPDGLLAVLEKVGWRQ